MSKSRAVAVLDAYDLRFTLAPYVLCMTCIVLPLTSLLV
jgi:hypothetical protein